MNISTWTPSESAFPDKAFALRPTNVGQWLFLCGQHPSASSHVTLRFICTFFGENNLNQKKIFSNTEPTAPMPSIRSISAARSSHSTICIQLRLVECDNCILILGTFQVTTKQQVLGINAITSLLYNPTQIAHDSKYILYHCPFSNSTCFILSLI